MKKIKNKLFEKILNLYPPFLGAGIKIEMPNSDMSEFNVSMNLTRLNKNYVGSHYGGSLYSMCDPFFMLILLEKLGKEYIVWDKSASIDFLRPGKGRVHAHFTISDEQVQEIIKLVDKDGKCEPEFDVEVKNKEGKNVARVHKKLWVKKKESQT